MKLKQIFCIHDKYYIDYFDWGIYVCSKCGKVLGKKMQENKCKKYKDRQAKAINAYLKSK